MTTSKDADDELTNTDWMIIAFTGPEEIGLSPVEQAAVYGEKISSDAELNTLKERFAAGMSPENLERANRLVDIALAVDTLFRGDSGNVAWLNRPDGDLDGKTPKELLISGELSNITRVLGVLEVMLGVR